MSRYARTLAFLAACLLCVLFATSLHQTSNTPRQDFSQIYTRLSSLRGNGLCTSAQWSRGNWQLRESPPKSLSEIATGQDFISETNFECVGETAGGTLDRILSVARYEWQAACAQAEWNAMHFVETCLRMPYGLLLAGDSITGQNLKSLAALIGSGDDAILIESPKYPGRLSGGTTYLLNPVHSAYAHFLNNGFSRQRLEKPILTQFWTFHLVYSIEQAALMPREDPRQPVTRIRAAYSKDTDDADWLPEVERILASYDDIPPAIGRKEGTKKTVLVLNTGPHWHVGRFENLAESNKSRAMFEGYQNVAHYLVNRLTNGKGSDHLQLIYRSMTYPRGDCRKFTEPLTSRDDVYLEDLYNFLHFPSFDNVWKDMQLKVQVIDVGPLTGLRPDAGRSPWKGDCHHFCLPVVHEWTRMLWTLMQDR